MLGFESGAEFASGLAAYFFEPSEIQAMAMVRDVDQDNWRDAPAFLGFEGCLERLRFAADPTEEKFYFGPCP